MMHIRVIMQGQSDLMEVVRTRHTVGASPRYSDSWEKKGDEHSDDCDYHQELHESEGSASDALKGTHG
jgi:hypothetical protein